MARDQYDDKRAQNGQGHEPDAFTEDDAGDAAAAFEALRATMETLAADLTREMTVIRKGVEFTLDQMEQRGAPVDYSAELGRMNQNQAATNERLHGIEQSPVLRHGPEHYARVIERGGEGLVRSAVQLLEQEGRALRSAARDLADQTYSARDRRRQDWWLVGIGGAGIVLGILLTLFTPRVLPLSVAPRVASTVMGDNAWNAGMALMMFAGPDSWSRVVASDKLVDINKDAVADCRNAAAKTAKGAEMHHYRASAGESTMTGRLPCALSIRSRSFAISGGRCRSPRLAH